jgi:hypothetical protein
MNSDPENYKASLLVKTHEPIYHYLLAIFILPDAIRTNAIISVRIHFTFVRFGY